jgi:hypothetical protein
MTQRAHLFVQAALLMLFLPSAGCARHEGLAPAPGAIVPLDHPNQASAEEQGIRIFVDGDAWRGEPSDLERRMTALWVRVENRSGLPIRLMYQDFKVESGKQILSPLPPLVVEAPGAGDDAPESPPDGTGSLAHGFYLLPFYRRYHPNAQVWRGLYPFNPTFYRSRHLLWQAPLPSPEMVRRALLEGFLVAGGSASGFLYFPPLPADTRGVITFWASMPSAPDETSFVNMKIGLRRR